jgi:hypothetical protein
MDEAAARVAAKKVTAEININEFRFTLCLVAFIICESATPVCVTIQPKWINVETPKVNNRRVDLLGELPNGNPGDSVLAVSTRLGERLEGVRRILERIAADRGVSPTTLRRVVYRFLSAARLAVHVFRTCGRQLAR